MNRLWVQFTLIVLFKLLATPVAHAEQGDSSRPRLIIRTDDIGFCHGVNMAFKRVAEQGVVTSASVIVNTPWLDEAVAILKAYPEISVGVHLALNSEWREYKWGPIAPYTEVRSLVDPFGKFYGSRKELFMHEPRIREVEKELRAQIKLAERKGLKLSYIDNHMGAAISAFEFQQIMEKLAKEFQIGISRYYGEREVPTVYDVPPAEKLTRALQNVNTITNAGLHLLVCHIGTDSPEMAAMSDLNAFGPQNMSKHRQAEADVLCAPEFKEALRSKGTRLVGYQELLGHSSMERPFVAEKYKDVVRKAKQ
jgi:predicted glycoside hydrolase/deacetylase ChbG (UPF0249 family)